MKFGLEPVQLKRKNKPTEDTPEEEAVESAE
jgi:hypothetical protein